MLRRWIIYLVTLLSCLVFYGFYREWFSWFLLLAVAFLPLFSLILSLPAMLTMKAVLTCPETVCLGQSVRSALQPDCKYPSPPVSARIRLYNSLTDTKVVGKPGKRIPTDHCGMVTVAYDRLYIYDYLGLFCRRLRRKGSCAVYVTPKPVPAVLPRDFAGNAVLGWKPKPGGGFSENHDLRLYRPGDDLRGIHWKLSAKTGNIVYREPIEPVRRGCSLTMTLSGTPKQMDRKLGQLLWMSQALLKRQIDHEVRCATGAGEVQFRVKDPAGWEKGLRTLLRSTPVKQENEAEDDAVLLQPHTGGDGYEA